MKNTKSFLLSLITFLLFTVSLTAQTTIGLRTGINFSTLAIEGPDRNGFSMFDSEGVNLGIFLNVPLGEKISLQPEFNYNRKVTNLLNFDFPDVPNIEADLVFNSIDLSLLAKYRFGNQKLGFSIAAGPFLNVLVDGAFKVKADGNKIKSKIPLNGLGMDRLEMGAVLGAGVDFPVGPGKMHFDVRYNLGLTGIFYSTGVVQNQSVGVSIGYAIKI